ncbi:leukosialin-like [Hemiscyllium ocellatum]|uniref:leukosialin-like n=1 Tax=Hemiscyllium ocellatum TaxID=170820 RepID=UPI0029667111|nr:leukosialin-like [Hemiscyllium ocellatum]
MKAIQLITLALLADSLGGTITTNSLPTMGSEETNSGTPTSFHNSSNSMQPWLNTTTPTITNAPSSDLPSGTSFLTNTPSTTSQFTSEVSSEVQSIQSATSQSTSHLTTKHESTKSTLMTTITSKSTTKQLNNGTAARIIAYVIGGALLLMLIIICILLLRKRCAKRPSEDQTWAGTCPSPTEMDLHAFEVNDNNVAPTKRPSLTTFLSKKSKRESLLDQSMQESEGVVNTSSPETEEKLIEPEVKVENETAKEIQPSETHNQDFKPPNPPEAQTSVNDHEPAASSPATHTDGPAPAQEAPELDPSISLPPPPDDFLDFVNNSDNPPPLLELQV